MSFNLVLGIAAIIHAKAKWKYVFSSSFKLQDHLSTNYICGKWNVLGFGIRHAFCILICHMETHRHTSFFIS